jgi:hypothetical protein
MRQPNVLDKPIGFEVLQANQAFLYHASPQSAFKVMGQQPAMLVTMSAK